MLPKDELEEGQKVSAILRPEKITVAESVENVKRTEVNTLKGKLLRTIFLGDIYETHFQIDGDLVFKVPLDKEYPAGKTFHLMFNKEEVKILVKWARVDLRGGMPGTDAPYHSQLFPNP